MFSFHWLILVTSLDGRMHVWLSLPRRRGKNTYCLKIRISPFVQRGKNTFPRILLIIVSLFYNLSVKFIKITKVVRIKPKIAAHVAIALSGVLNSVFIFVSFC